MLWSAPFPKAEAGLVCPTGNTLSDASGDLGLNTQQRIHLYDSRTKLLYVVVGSNINRYDMTIPTSPSMHSSYAEPSGYLPKSMILDAKRNILFVSYSDSTLRALDINSFDSDPAISSLPISNYEFQLLLLNPYLYGINQTTDELTVYNVTYPESMSFVMTTETAMNQPYWMTISPDETRMAIACITGDTINLFDISTKASPSQAGVISGLGALTNGPAGIAFIDDNTTVHIAGAGSAMATIDVTNMTSPSVIASITSNYTYLQYAASLWFCRDTALLVVTNSQKDSGFTIDLSDPSTLTIQGSAITDPPDYLTYLGDNMFFGTGSLNEKIIELTTV